MKELAQPESLIKKSPAKKSAKIKICNVANKPILSAAVEQEIHSAVAQFLGQTIWYDWGMKNYRKQGSLILLYGPPGTGKTTTARYLTQIISRPLAILDMGTFGSSTPGEAERGIGTFFADAEHHRSTVLLDEADSILWDRSKAGGDSMWMVSIINALLKELAEYRHLAIIATNRESELDQALESRIIAKVHVTRPDFETRVKLWHAKVPKKYPLQLTHFQVQTLSQYDLSGRTIETAIFKEAQMAILEQRVPQFDSLCNVAKSLEGK